MCVCGQYADNVEFMWRLARAYSDMCETAHNREEKRNYAEQGEEISHFLTPCFMRKTLRRLGNSPCGVLREHYTLHKDL